MKKIILTTAMYLLGLCSCTYEYEMPDTSNLSPSYSIENNLDSNLLKEWENIVNEEYHLNLSNPNETQWEYIESKWKWIVTEKDIKGNILYEGEPRKYADNNTYSIDVAYVCYVRLNKRNEYSEYARFKMSQSYLLGKTPLPIIIDINEESQKYIVEFPPESERVYAYDIQCDDSIYKLLSSQGLTFRHSGIMVTEKDENGNILYAGDIEKFYGLEDYHISIKGTITVEIQINLNQGILYFNEKFKLKDFGNQTLILSTDNDYTLITTASENYMYDIDYSSDIYALMVRAVQSVGYDLYDFTINVIEKDKDGNILYQGEKPGKHGNLGNSQKGAKYLNIYIDLYGYHSENYPFEDEIKIATITFNETFELNEINNKILTLTPDNPYTIEFDEIEQSSYIYSISLDSSISAAINEQLINPANCRFGHYEIIVTERDADGNVLYQGEYEIHTTKQSEEGAKTLEAAIDVYGYDKDTYPFGEEKKIGSIIFTEMFNLAEIDNPFILSARDYAHRYERYY